jgi:hypothetical protein
MAHIIKDVFTPEQLAAIREKINSSPRIVDKKHGRYISSIRTPNDLRADDSPISLPDDIHDRIKKLATDNCSKTAKPSYIKAAKYSGFLNPLPNLPAHLDDNACSYTIDLQLSSNIDWPLHVNGEAFTLKDNWAVVYDGENDLHWRENFPSRNPMSFTHMIFFHFVEPEHWFFRIPHLTSEENGLNHENRLIREAPLLVKYGKQDGTENKYVR